MKFQKRKWFESRAAFVRRATEELFRFDGNGFRRAYVNSARNELRLEILRPGAEFPIEVTIKNPESYSEEMILALAGDLFFSIACDCHQIQSFDHDLVKLRCFVRRAFREACNSMDKSIDGLRFTELIP